LCEHALADALKSYCSSPSIRVTTDAEALLDTFFAGCDGIVLIAGTGSICVGARRIGAKRVTARAGGWGSYLDSGCGFRLGLWVLEAALKSLDGGGDATLAVEILCRQYGLKLGQVPEHFLPVRRERVADLARIAIEAACRGDRPACGLVRQAITDLVDLVLAVEGRLGLVRPFDLLISGGLFENRYMRSSFKRVLRRRLPSASILEIAEPLPLLLCRR
jgi:N-acetylglucosamine kinase-like BadF-type ATPase